MERDKLVAWIRKHVAVRRAQVVYSRAIIEFNGDEIVISAGSLSEQPEDLELDGYQFEQYPVKDLLPTLVCDCGETIKIDGDIISGLLAHIEAQHPKLEE
jgi:RNase P/RNase MRP subunit p29